MRALDSHAWQRSTVVLLAYGYARYPLLNGRQRHCGGDMISIAHGDEASTIAAATRSGVALYFLGRFFFRRTLRLPHSWYRLVGAAAVTATIPIRSARRPSRTMTVVCADDLAVEPPVAARRLLGAVLRSGPVGVRIVEVEAYGGDPAGPWPDPASHSGRGRTKRNAVMFGPAGVLYVYLSYGMHMCVNVTSGPDGTASAVLIRSGEVVEGLAEVRTRRPAARTDAALARGPGNLGSALGITLSDYGIPLFDPSSPIRLELNSTLDPAEIASGPRVGVSTAAEQPWRFWLASSPAVSVYRRSPRAPRIDEASRARVRRVP